MRSAAVAAALIGALPWALAHPFGPTCFGFGTGGGSGDGSCADADPSSFVLTGGQGSHRSAKVGQEHAVATKVTVRGCAQRPCWLQRAKVAVLGGSGEGAARRARAAVYLASGRLVGVSEPAEAESDLPADAWLELPFRGRSLELATRSETEEVWLVVHFESLTSVVSDEAAVDEASRVATQAWEGRFSVSQDRKLRRDDTHLRARGRLAAQVGLALDAKGGGFAVSHDWTAERGRLQEDDKHLRARVQLEVGDVTVLPGSLPLILEAPHGGRVKAGWASRTSGRLVSDENTDLLAQDLRSDLGRRCGGRLPRAVILNVHRQGLDANRATGDSHVGRDGVPCSEQRGGECCCAIPDAGDAAKAMRLNDEYHSRLRQQLEGAGPRALLVTLHGLARQRLEVGTLLSKEELNKAAAENPRSLAGSDAESSLRALGPADALVWGNSSLGALLASSRPGLEVLPSPGAPCPDPKVCPASSSASYYRGGYTTAVHASAARPAVQLELPQDMRGFGAPAPPEDAVRQVGAALASFLNEHYAESCDTAVDLAGAALAGTAALASRPAPEKPPGSAAARRHAL